ncbi:RND family transporter [Planctomycetota bacterium]
MKRRITAYSINHYKLVTVIMVATTLVLGAFMPGIRVDTDPENMLAEDEAVRVQHDQTKEDFSLSDIVVLGVVNDKHPEGVFNVTSLTWIYELTEYVKTWRSQKDPNEGVIEVDLMAPSVVDHISQAELGTVSFEWLMPKPPTTEAEALLVRDRAMSNPLLKGTLVSEDGKALSVFIPLTHKHISYELYRDLSAKLAHYEGDDEFHVTGLPVAEDTFGYEMFKQMAISAPAAMVVIFILMLLFFRKLVLVISPMIVAMVSVISTMGLLIGFGFPVHIMSSMIPIFLMPIAVVDSVHILSEFFDLYTKEKGRKGTIVEVMDDLFMPMLYTSLTSAAGFASLALTPIPPVQVFGIFVATGIMIAWMATITFVPAYVMMLKESSLTNFGAAAHHEDRPSGLSRLLGKVGGLTYRAAKPILALVLILGVIATYGITQIQINDNPTKWFSKTHPIRRADIELNKHFGGTYMAYLVFKDPTSTAVDANYVGPLRERLLAFGEERVSDMPLVGQVIRVLETMLLDMASSDVTKVDFMENLLEAVVDKEADANDTELDAWAEMVSFIEQERQQLDVFKQPETLRYLVGLQDYLVKEGLIGKSSSLADVVRKVHQELIDGQPENYRIPDSPEAVAQCLIQYQSSHRPGDLWHFVTQDYRQTNVWIQLQSGDNRDMKQVLEAVDAYTSEHVPPRGIGYHWAGLTYINVEWQNKMVGGMLVSLLGSFIIVFIMMALLFRSPLWGLLCMVPLSVTIALIYGVIGLIGKDYDMPVAVLSALTLGMAVDFAIHFLERARATYAEHGSWQASVGHMFAEPARAITRNVLVIAIGFLPLLAAPLMPYKTVGIFLCAIMGLSGAVTLIVLPALLTVLEKRAFKEAKAEQSLGCSCLFCGIISVSTVLLVGMNIHQFWHLGWTRMAWGSAVAVVVMLLVCRLLSRRHACRAATADSNRKN